MAQHCPQADCCHHHDHHHHRPDGDGAEMKAKSRMRHDRRPARQAPAHHEASLLFLLGQMPREVHCRSGKVSAAGDEVGSSASRHDLHLPDAPRDRQVGLDHAHLRHGPRARVRVGDSAQSRACRHDPAFLIRLALALLFSCWRCGHLTDMHRCSRSSIGLDPARIATVVLWVGWPFFERAWASLKTRNLNMFTHRHGYRRRARLQHRRYRLASLFPVSMRGRRLGCHHFEAAAVITVLVLLGQVLELRARESTSGAIKALLDLSPKIARRTMPTAPILISASTR